MNKKILFIFTIISLLFCSWEQVAFPNIAINGILFDEDDIYMIDFEGIVYQSSNNGIQWEEISEINDILPYGINVFKKINNYLIIIQNITANANIYRSYFNGIQWESWEEINSLSFNIINSLHYNEELYVIADNLILISNDYGNTWATIDSPIINGYPNLLMVNENFIYVSFGCNLYKISKLNYFWENITTNLNDIGPEEPYSCTVINDIEFYNNNLIASVYWYGGVGTLLRNENNQWIEIESFPAEHSNGYIYSISDLLAKYGVLYAGTASSQNGIFYTEDLDNWIEYSNGLESFDLSVNELNSTNDKIFKYGGTVNYYKNNLISPSINGDFNLDGILNILDILILVNHILNKEAIELDSADINNDNNFNILDLLQLINIILGNN